MAKQIPTEQLITLYNQLEQHPARSPKRKVLIEEVAHGFDVSASTVRRQLSQHIYANKKTRSDKNKPRVFPETEMLMYCRLIAALKLRTANKKNRHLSTPACIRILETHGIETKDGLMKAPAGLLKKTTVNRYLKQYGYSIASLSIEPVVIRFEAEQSNDAWQFDFSPSELKYLSDQKKEKLFIASVTDDKSGVLYSEYVECYGEDALTALRFLFNAMAAKARAGFIFQGIPKFLYIDNGPFAKSNVFKRALAALGIEVQSHLPKGKDGRRTTARAKGKIERTNRTLKEEFETCFHLHRPKNLAQANEWLANYLHQYNAKNHRSENSSRLQVWKSALPQEGFQAMCSWEKFCQFVRQPETRIVASDACISVEGIPFQLSPELAGQQVTLLLGLLDNEVYVEYQEKRLGPFYPSAGPIPLHTYKTPKKTSQEQQADELHALAKELSVPLSIMTGKQEDSTIQQLNAAHIIQTPETNSVPFKETETKAFRNRLEAKQAIAKMLSRPLAELTPEQLAYIHQVLDESLNKSSALSKIKHYFSLKLCQLDAKEMA